LVIGRTLTSLLYAWRLQKKCILLEPFCFYNLSDEYDGIDFSEFGVESAEELLNNLLFTMGITNLLLYQGEVSTYRPDENEIITKRNTRIKLKKKPVIFDGKDTGEYQVFDEFYWRKGRAHDTTFLQLEDDFCNRIYFYTSKRGPVSCLTKDFTVMSKMDENQLLDSDYGVGMVRIRTHRIMKDNAIYGEYTYTRNDKKFYRKPVFDFEKRTRLPRIEQKKTFKQVYNMKQKEGEQWIMWKRLMSKERTWLGSYR